MPPEDRAGVRKEVAGTSLFSSPGSGCVPPPAGPLSSSWKPLAGSAWDKEGGCHVSCRMWPGGAFQLRLKPHGGDRGWPLASVVGIR